MAISEPLVATNFGYLWYCATDTLGQNHQNEPFVLLVFSGLAPGPGICREFFIRHEFARAQLAA